MKGVSLETILHELVEKNMAETPQGGAKTSAPTGEKNEGGESMPYRSAETIGKMNKAELIKRRLSFLDEGPRRFDVDIPKDYPPASKELF